MAKPKTKKKSHRLYALIVILLGLAIIAMTVLLLFYVQKIEVKGNEYTSNDTIIESIQEDQFSFNSLYVLAKYRLKKPEIPGSLSSMKIGLKNPWTLKVTVQEKPIIGYLYEADNYVFFDEEGTVVLKGREMIEGTPCIEGIDISKAELYKSLNVESKKLFQAILDVAKEVKNYELTPDRIVCIDEGIALWFGQIRVLLGTDINTEKMAQIRPIIDKLEGKSGTLHLEHYESGASTITFREETFNEDGTVQQAVSGTAEEAVSGEAEEEASTDDEETVQTEDAGEYEEY